MLRTLIAMLLFTPALGAVTPVFDEEVEHGLELQSAEVRLHVSRVEGRYVVATDTMFVVVNDSEDVLESRFALPQEVVPRDQRDRFKLTAAGLELPEPDIEDGRWQWRLTLQPSQRLDLSWSYTADATRLPQDHPLVHRLVRVPFRYVRGFAELPEIITVRITYTGLNDEQFGRDRPLDGEDIRADIKVDRQMPSVEYRFFENTTEEAEQILRGRLDAFDAEHKTANNRSYTDTLVHLYDVLKLRGDHASMAEVCGTLADLEKASGRAITLCGPWAKWRRYVPWALCRFASQREAGEDAVEAAEAATTVMAERWPLYLKARNERRPYDHFDAAKYGNYWDYDWKRTREVYVAALELLREDELVRDVKQAGVDE